MAESQCWGFKLCSLKLADVSGSFRLCNGDGSTCFLGSAEGLVFLKVSLARDKCQGSGGIFWRPLAFGVCSWEPSLHGVPERRQLSRDTEVCRGGGCLCSHTGILLLTVVL